MGSHPRERFDMMRLFVVYLASQTADDEGDSARIECRAAATPRLSGAEQTGLEPTLHSGFGDADAYGVSWPRA
jgi:hypothetical protein